MSLVLIVHNIRSAHNVGSIFRTADAAGVSHIYLTGYTPRPLDRFQRPQKEIAKTALGAQVDIPWSYHKEPTGVIKHIKKEGFFIYALEQDARAVDYRSVNKKEKVALIVGNEVRGVSPALLNKADAIIEIPMKGKKESLNVSVATGIALFALS